MSSPYDFQPSALPADAFDVDVIMRKHKVSREEAERVVMRHRVQRVLLSKLYQVNITDVPAQPNGWPAMTWLSIKRRDKDVIRDWRVLQRIKNAVLSPEHEAVELFPAESRLVDTANQYHLWAIADPAHRFPFGFGERLVRDADQATGGSRQRPFSEG